VLAALLAVMGVLAILVVAVAGGAVTAIYQTALYEYGRTGAVPVGFSPGSIENAFRPKAQPSFFGIGKDRR
jgi:hypothetical protein